MRIVFALDGRPQVSVGGQKGNSQVEVLIVDTSGDTPETFREGDAIYIEGKISSIRSACRSVLTQLELIEKGGAKPA